MATDHDPFDCACHETCSWCLKPVHEESLFYTLDGARICRSCKREYFLDRRAAAKAKAHPLRPYWS